MFQDERQLQEWLAGHLQARGVNVDMEVITSRLKSRADIITNYQGQRSVIECKMTLTREKILAAYAQADIYSKNLGIEGMVLIGMAPFNQVEQQAATTAALMVQTANPTAVIYWVTPAGLVAVGERRSSVLDILALNPRRVTIPTWKLVVFVCWIIFGLIYGGSFGMLVGAIAGIWFILWR